SLARQSALQDEAKQAIAALQVSGQTDRKAMSEQLNTLAVRLDHLEKEVDSLKSAPSQISRPSNKTSSGEETPIITETKSSAPEEKGSPGDPIAPAETKRPEGAGGNSPSEPAAREGTITARGGADLGGRKLGPIGCEHFRSFDVASGTYVALDGRRRPCR